MLSKDLAIQVAVVGVGYMGRKHAETYRALPGATLVAVVDTNIDRARQVAQECGCIGYASVAQLLKHHPELQAASIAVPTIYHTQVAELLIGHGIACLIEKPLASSTRQAELIAALADRERAIVQVGLVERFNPAIRAVRRLHLKPLMIKADRVSRMPFRSLDIDVVLDVMIHDLDLALLFTGSGVDGIEIEARGLALENQAEHICTARLLFPGGCMADLNASRIALTSKREIRIFTKEFYISIDCRKKKAFLIREADYLKGLDIARRMSEAGQEITDLRFRELVRVQDLVSPEEEAQDALTLELDGFLTSVRQQQRPEVDLQAGLKTLALAEQVVEAMRSAKVAIGTTD